MQTVKRTVARLEWKANNELERADFEKAIKEGKKKCFVMGTYYGNGEEEVYAPGRCPNVASNLHHLDHDRKNDSPQNLSAACLPHHMLEHGNTPELGVLKLIVRHLRRSQKGRVASNNATLQYEKLAQDFFGGDEEARYWLQACRDDVDRMEKAEKDTDKLLKRILDRFPIYVQWLSQVKGISVRLGGELIAEIGSIAKFPSPSRLWAYAGEPVDTDGNAVRKRKRNADGEWSGNWNHNLKRCSWLVGDQFVKQRNCLGRQLYEKAREYYINRDGTEKGVHARAMRKARKDFLRCLWAAWRELEGLPLTTPRPGTWPMPEDWIDGKR